MSSESDNAPDADERLDAAIDVIEQCLTADRWLDNYEILRDNFELIADYGDAALDSVDRAARSEDFADNLSQAKIAEFLDDIRNVRSILVSCAGRGLGRTFATIDLQTADVPGAALSDLLDRIDGEPDVRRQVQRLRAALELGTDRSVPLQALLHLEMGRALAVGSGGEPAASDEEALEHLHWALDTYIRDADWSDWGLAHSTIAQLYARRTHGDGADNIERAIEHFHLALQFYARATPVTVYAQLAVQLASCCSERLRGDPWENLARATECCEVALNVLTREDDPKTWALAHAQLCEYQVEAGSGSVGDVVAHADAAAEVLTELASPWAWADIQHYAGRAYLQHYYLGDRSPEALELGIDRLNAALRVVTREGGEARFATIQRLLGEAYKDRAVGDLSDNVERAIACFEVALEATPTGAERHAWAVIQCGLGTCFFRRSTGDGRRNRSLARKHYEAALSALEKEESPTLWASIHQNLATVYWDPTDPSRAEYEAEAIAHTELALEILTKADHPYDWAALQTNLASYYLSRVTGSRSENLARARRHATAALEVRTQDAYPSDWAQTQMILGATFSAEAGADPPQHELAASHFSRALSIYRPDSHPGACRRVATALGDLAFDREQWKEAVAAYQDAVEAVRILYESAVLRRTRRLQTLHVDVHHQAAYALGRLGRAGDALIMLESGRALELRSFLEAPDMAGRAASADPEALALYREAQVTDRAADALDPSIGLPRMLQLSGEEAAAFVGQITDRKLETMPDTLVIIDDGASADEQVAMFTRIRREREAVVRTARETAARLRRTAVERLRAWPGLEHFAADPAFEEVVTAASPDSPLVFITVTTKGSMALIVHRDDAGEPSVDTIWLDDFSPSRVGQLVLEWQDAQERAADLEALLERTLAGIETGLIGPVTTHLRTLGFDRATLLPTGQLTFLPLHAAGMDADNAVNFTYAPSARAVAVARAEQRDRAPVTRSLLAVGNPLPDDMPLPFAREEVMRVSPWFETATTLFEGAASVAGVLGAAAAATHVHFACHCVVDASEPLHSRLELADLPLHLRDVFYERADVWSAATLVVVSACQTGAPDVAAPDEAISWPTAFLLAGVPTVVAAQWPVDDVSTALLMSKFYALLLDPQTSPALDAATALAHAQRWMRTVTIRELRKGVERGELGGAVVEDIAAHVEDSGPHCQPFAGSPFDWAGFAAYGV